MANKFKLGDEVRVIRHPKHLIGEITCIDCENDYNENGQGTENYKCIFHGNKNDYHWYNASDLESIPKILDKEEKEYLSAVIRPFRKRVEHIVKCANRFRDGEFITIRLNNEVFSLPDFIPNTMYRGMNTDKYYSLEELGL